VHRPCLNAPIQLRHGGKRTVTIPIAIAQHRLANALGHRNSTASSESVAVLRQIDAYQPRTLGPMIGRIAYVEKGIGAVALFLHGLPLNGFHWRGAMARQAVDRRCIAPDLLGLGYTETRPDQDLAPATQPEVIAEEARRLWTRKS
jgi:haloalkane dehalogenase